MQAGGGDKGEREENEGAEQEAAPVSHQLKGCIPARGGAGADTCVVSVEASAVLFMSRYGRLHVRICNADRVSKASKKGQLMIDQKGQENHSSVEWLHVLFLDNHSHAYRTCGGMPCGGGSSRSAVQSNIALHNLTVMPCSRQTFFGFNVTRLDHQLQQGLQH